MENNTTQNDDTTQYVAILECSAGNESVGNMWVETHICNSKTTIKELMEWKKTRCYGERLTISKAS